MTTDNRTTAGLLASPKPPAGHSYDGWGLCWSAP